MIESLPEQSARDAGGVIADTAIGGRLLALLGAGTEGQRKLADFILRSPVQASVLPIEELARVTATSAPTISRFAREAGFAGIAEFRAALGAAIQGVLDPVAKLSAKLSAQQRRGDGVPDGRPDCADMLAVIQAQVARLDPARMAGEVTGVAAMIVRARQVHVMGFGLSAHAAGLLALGLQPFHAGASTVVDYGGTEVAAGRLMALDARDLLIAISFPRYARDAVRLMRYARASGAAVVAITDGPASPLAAAADTALFAPAAHPALSSSYTAAIAVIETLVAAVMLSDPANAERAARLGDAISGYLHAR